MSEKLKFNIKDDIRQFIKYDNFIKNHQKAIENAKKIRSQKGKQKLNKY